MLWLVKCGVPWDVAWSLDEEERLAAVVVTGEAEGNKFNWSRLTWEERNP